MAGWEEAGLEKKLKNTLPLYGNKESMNLNSMILTNVLGSPYFKEELINYKTFHEVVDEIYYKVDHLEPWEKNSRKLAGQVGMCAGVRGVAAGGIVSTAYCLLYKLFTLKLTRKQVNVMMNHVDSPYIRGLGFMYVRYCQPPANFWDWFGPYIDDPEEIDLKAGGGYTVTIGEMCRMFMTKLDWFGTLFPRMPVNVGRDLEQKIKEVKLAARNSEPGSDNYDNGQAPDPEDVWGEAEKRAREVRGRTPTRSSRERSRSRERRRSPRYRNRSRSNERRKNRSRSRERRRSRSQDRERRRSHSRDRQRRRSRSWSRDRDRRSRRSRSHSRDRGRKSHHDRSKEREHSRSSRKERRSRSQERSRDKKRRSQSRS